MKTYLCVHLGAVFLSMIITPVVIWLAKRVSAVDSPGVRKIHDRPIPRIGGVAIFFSSLCMIVAVLFVDNNIGDRFRTLYIQLSTLLFTATAIFIVGLVDDLRGLPAWFKFSAEVAAAASLCFVGVRMDTIGLPGGHMVQLGWLGCLLTLLWIVGITNAVNLSDGLDGLAAGISTIACGAIAIIAIRNNEHVLAVFMLALAGSLAGFLVFNFNPAKVFMGDCGSLFVGYIIAGTSVLCVAKSAAAVGLALPILALGIPIFDTLFSMLRRFVERRSIFAPDRCHFHHQLLALGLTQRHVVAIIYVATCVCTGLGFFMLVRDDYGAWVVFGCLLLLLVILFRVVGAVRFRQVLIQLQEKWSVAQLQRQERHTFEKVELQLREVQDPGQWWAMACRAADGLDFAWVSWKTVQRTGELHEEVWRASMPKSDMSRLMITKIPLVQKEDGRHDEMEIAVWTNGSLEAAARRVALFGRLMDEHGAGVGEGAQPDPASGGKEYGGRTEMEITLRTNGSLEAAAL